MAKTEVADWSTTAADNTDVGGINIAENCPAANVNNALREIMKQLADLLPDLITATGVGTTVQGYDAGLASIAGLTTTADRMIYTTASDVYAVATLTSYARTLLDDTSASSARTTLNLGNASTLDLASTAEATAGNLNTRLMTPYLVDQYFIRYALGFEQTWQDVTSSRALNTSYQNTTDQPIQVTILITSADARPFEVSTDDATWVQAGGVGGDSGFAWSQAIVPPSHYYRVNGTGTLSYWSELRE